MRALRGVNLAVAFFLELAVLIAVGYWGFHLGGAWRFVAGLGTPILFAALWGRFAAPKAAKPLHGAVSVAFQVTWFACGAAALVLAGQSVLGAVPAAGYAVNSVSLLIVRH